MSEKAFIRTTILPTPLRVAQVVGLTSTAFLAGKTFTQTFSAVPALLHADAPLLAKQWKTMFDSDKLLAPVIVVYSSAIFGCLAWREPTRSPNSLLNTLSTLLLLSTIPYSLLLLEPLTQRLEAKAVEFSSSSSAAVSEQAIEKEQTTHWLVDRWATINLGRAMISGVAAATAIWAGVGGVRISGISVVSGGEA